MILQCNERGVYLSMKTKYIGLGRTTSVDNSKVVTHENPAYIHVLAERFNPPTGGWVRYHLLLTRNEFDSAVGRAIKNHEDLPLAHPKKGLLLRFAEWLRSKRL